MKKTIFLAIIAMVLLGLNTSDIESKTYKKNTTLILDPDTSNPIICNGVFTTQPINKTGNLGASLTYSFVHSGTGYDFMWQSNSATLGWINVPNGIQYSGATTQSLVVNNLKISNHKQLFRVVAFKGGCAISNVSNEVSLSINNIAVDSIRLVNLKSDSTRLTLDSIFNSGRIISLRNDSIKNNLTIISLNADILSKEDKITFLNADTTAKSIIISKLQIDLANKHDTLYIISSITSDTLKISIHTGISKTSPIINSLKVYPNPTSTIIHVDLEKPGSYLVKVSSINGQSIITLTNGTIDISSLANGIYTLTIFDDDDNIISVNKISIIR